MFCIRSRLSGTFRNKSLENKRIIFLILTDWWTGTPPTYFRNFVVSWYKGRSLFDIHHMSFVELLMWLVWIIVLEGLHIVIGRWGHEAVDDVYGNWKYDGRIVLCRDAVQCLEVAQLKNILCK